MTNPGAEAPEVAEPAEPLSMRMRSRGHPRMLSPGYESLGDERHGISTMLIIEPSFALYSNTWIVPGCSVSTGASTCA